MPPGAARPPTSWTRASTASLPRNGVGLPASYHCTSSASQSLASDGSGGPAFIMSAYRWALGCIIGRLLVERAWTTSVPSSSTSASRTARRGLAVEDLPEADRGPHVACVRGEAEQRQPEQALRRAQQRVVVVRRRSY